MTDDALSEAARERSAALEAKMSRGEKVTWLDLIGILEPNPDLPYCQSWDGDIKCQLPNHHETPHRAVVTWGVSRTGPQGNIKVTGDQWTTRDVAAYTGKKESTIRAYHARGQMPAPDGRIGRTPWWKPETIKAWR